MAIIAPAMAPKTGVPPNSFPALYPTNIFNELSRRPPTATKRANHGLADIPPSKTLHILVMASTSPVPTKPGIRGIKIFPICFNPF